jgi:hypothetical protein
MPKPERDFNFTLMIWIGVTIGIINGVIVNTNKEILQYSVAFLPLAGGLLYSIINGDIADLFQDFVGSIVSFFFLSWVGILFVSILTMLPVGLIVYLL